MDKSETRYEWVRPSWRNRGYFRRRPYTRDNPTIAQLKMRYLLARIAHNEAFGKRGFVERNGRLIPASAAVVGDRLRGVRVAPPKKKTLPEALERLRPVFEQIGRQVSNFKPINELFLPRIVEGKSAREKEKIK